MGIHDAELPEYKRCSEDGRNQSRKAHPQEVQYVYGLGPERFEAADYALSDAMQEYWTNFAKTGDPNGIRKRSN